MTELGFKSRQFRIFTTMIIVLVTIKIIMIIPRGSELSVPGSGLVVLGRPQGFLPGMKGDGFGLISLPLAIHRGGSLA